MGYAPPPQLASYVHSKRDARRGQINVCLRWRESLLAASSAEEGVPMGVSVGVPVGVSAQQFYYMAKRKREGERERDTGERQR